MRSDDSSDTTPQIAQIIQITNVDGELGLADNRVVVSDLRRLLSWLCYWCAHYP